MVPWPILYWRFTENQGLLVSVQPVCAFQPYELLLQQYFCLTVKYIHTFIIKHLKKLKDSSCKASNVLKLIFKPTYRIKYTRRKMDIQKRYLDIQLCDRHLTYSVLISKFSVVISKIFISTRVKILSWR